MADRKMGRAKFWRPIPQKLRIGNRDPIAAFHRHGTCLSNGRPASGYVSWAPTIDLRPAPRSRHFCTPRAIRTLTTFRDRLRLSVKTDELAGSSGHDGIGSA